MHCKGHQIYSLSVKPAKISLPSKTQISDITVLSKHSVNENELRFCIYPMRNMKGPLSLLFLKRFSSKVSKILFNHLLSLSQLSEN
jgi:hypothetical protein